MTEEEIDAFVDVYRRYLSWNRLPEELPTSRDDVKRLTDQYLAHAGENPFEDDVWELFSLIHDDPDLAWKIIRRIVTAVSGSTSDLHLFGMGDLETFIHVQAVAYADQIEDAIRTDASFRTAFEHLRIGSSTPVAVGLRFNAALRESGVSETDIIDWWTDELPDSDSPRNE